MAGVTLLKSLGHTIYDILKSRSFIKIPLEVYFEASAHSLGANRLVELLDEARAFTIGCAIVKNFTHIGGLYLFADCVARTESLSTDTPIFVFQKS